MSFMTPLIINSSTGMALAIRPIQIFFREALLGSINLLQENGCSQTEGHENSR